MRKTNLLFLLISFFLLASYPVRAKEQTTLYLQSLESSYNEKGDLISIKTAIGAGTATIIRNTNYQSKETSISYLYSDYLSSTTVIDTYNDKGNQRTTLSYYPYGNTRETKGTKEDRLYTGQRKDSLSSLYFYNARYYNPVSSHFISADKAQGPNRYAYVFNNPIMMNDPTGNDAGFGGKELPTYFKTQTLIQHRNSVSLRGGFFVQNILDTVQDALGPLNPLPFQKMTIDSTDMQSVSWNTFRDKIDKEIGWGERLNKDNLSLEDMKIINNSIKKNIEFNKGQANIVNESLERGYNMPFQDISNTSYVTQGSLSQKISSGSNVCFEFSVYLHVYLGEKGIKNDIRAAEAFIGQNPLLLLRHAFVTLDDEYGSSYLLDPSFGIVMTENAYISGWKEGGDKGKNSFFIGPPVSIYQNPKVKKSYKQPLNNKLKLPYQ